MWIVGDQAGGGEAVLSKLLDSECEINCEVWCSLKSGNDKKLKSAASANNLIHNQKNGWTSCSREDIKSNLYLFQIVAINALIWN